LLSLVKVGYGIKLWLTNEKGESVFGDGLAELLEEIDKYHSLLEATKVLGMSYRYALHRITLAEARLGSLLVTRVHGGAKGGGSSEVTDLGKDLVLKYRSAQAKLDKAVKELP
jgi:molybdate transport system regulatory protein